MKRFSLFIILGLISHWLYSQTDTVSVADRIAAMDYSKSDIISKSRRLLIQDFNDGNREGVAQILRYLATQVDDEYHLSLWNSERYLLMYWTGDYSDILLNVEYAAADTTQHNRPVVYPSDPILGKTLLLGIKELYYDEIVADYKSMHFSPDANDFLNLFLDYLLDIITIDERNRLTDNFVKNYPYSPWVQASKKFISYKFTIGDYGLGMNFGGGYHFPSGSITDWISQSRGASIGFNFYYKKFSFGLSVISSSGKVLQDITLKQNGKIWSAGEKIEVDKFSIDLGMKVWEYKRLTFSPFAGIAFVSGNFGQTDPELKDIKLGTSITPVVGGDLDFRLNKVKSTPPTNKPYYYGYGADIWIIGIKTAYYPNLIRTQGPELRGQTWFMGLSFKMNVFSIKRVY